MAISVVPTVFLFHSNAKPSTLLCTYGIVVFVVLVLVNLFVYANLWSRNNSFDFSGTGKLTFLFAIGNLCMFKYFLADKTSQFVMRLLFLVDRLERFCMAIKSLFSA